MSTQISRREFVGATAAFMGTAALVGCSSGSSSTSSTSSTASTTTSAYADEPCGGTIKIELGASGQIFNAIAKEQGYLEEEGVKVEEVSISQDVMAALTSGKIDIVSNNGTNTPLQYISQGSPLTVFAGYMLTGCMPIIAKKGTVWNGVQDLAGKIVATSGGEFQVLKPYVDTGHTMDELTELILSGNDRLQAVISGKADYGIMGTGTNYAIKTSNDVDIMTYCSDITPNYSCCRIIAQTEFLEKNPKTVTGVLRAWLRAQCWYEGHKAETKKMVAEQTNTSEEYVGAYMDDEHYRLNLDPYRTSVERAWQWMGELDELGQGWESMNTADFINVKLYKDALDECTKKYGSENKDFYDKMNSIYDEYDA